MLAADAELEVSGRALRPRSRADAHQLADALLVDGHERVLRR